VIKRVKCIVVNTLNDLKTLGFGTAPLIEHAGMLHRDELVLPSVDDQSRGDAVDNVGLVVESVHNDVGYGAHELFCECLDGPVGTLKDERCCMLIGSVEDRD